LFVFLLLRFLTINLFDFFPCTLFESYCVFCVYFFLTSQKNIVQNILRVQSLWKSVMENSMNDISPSDLYPDFCWDIYFVGTLSWHVPMLVYCVAGFYLSRGVNLCDAGYRFARWKVVRFHFFARCQLPRYWIRKV
jgi:hypothetical protein